MKDCRTIRNWIVSVPAQFKELHNADSWQAHFGNRIVFASSKLVSRSGVPVAAEEITAVSRQGLDSGADCELHELADGQRVGRARIRGTDTGFQLKGSVCVTGSIALCVIDFASDDERDWAIATWKSLRHTAHSERK